MNKDEALRLALEALEFDGFTPEDATHRSYHAKAIAACKQALEQPEPEPVAWMWRCKPYCGWPEWSVSLNRPADSGRDGNKRTEGYEDIPLYTSPPKREPLTDEEIDEVPFALFEPDQGGMSATEALREFARAIEAAHGIKE